MAIEIVDLPIKHHDFDHQHHGSSWEWRRFVEVTGGAVGLPSGDQLSAVFLHLESPVKSSMIADDDNGILIIAHCWL